MGGDWPAILRAAARPMPRLRRNSGRRFPSEPAVTEATVVKALASYVRSLVSPPTRFDAWIGGEAEALTAAERFAASRLFTGKAGCMLCHVGWRFTDDRFHDIGLREHGPRPQRRAGRHARAGMAFKTPSLRELVHTAPYMHDGSLPTLQAVVKHYAGGFVPRPTLAPNMNRKLAADALRRRPTSSPSCARCRAKRRPARTGQGAAVSLAGVVSGCV